MKTGYHGNWKTSKLGKFPYGKDMCIVITPLDVFFWKAGMQHRSNGAAQINKYDSHIEKYYVVYGKPLNKPSYLSIIL